MHKGQGHFKEKLIQNYRTDALYLAELENTTSDIHLILKNKEVRHGAWDESAFPVLLLVVGTCSIHVQEPELMFYRKSTL